MATLTDILRQFHGFNFSVEVHENMANPDHYTVTIERRENYWFFGFFKKLKVKRFMKKLECLINSNMSDTLVPLSDVYYSLCQEKKGIIAETYTGKFRFTLSRSPVSELADYFCEYHSEVILTQIKWFNNGSPGYDRSNSNENRYYHFSSLYGVRIKEVQS